jgi:hypothetical protein
MGVDGAQMAMRGIVVSKQFAAGKANSSVPGADGPAPDMWSWPDMLSWTAMAHTEAA